MIQQWSFGAQRTIARNWDAEVDYVGTKSSHLFVLSNYNQPTISNGVSTKVVPYSNFGQIEYMSARGHGNYNGLQASLTKNLTHGYSFKAAYTLSHSLDNTPEELESSSGDAPNGRNYDAWYGNSDFDVRQRISVNFTWELPFGKGKTLFTSGPTASVFGGWRLSGVYTAYSGHPVTASLSSESSLLDAYGFATAVPNVVGSVHYLHNPKCWFYTSKNSSCSASSSLSDAFADPGKYVVGNSHRNTLVGPRTQVLDASLVKTIPIHRDWSGEFRWEVFNAANHALFGQPSGDLSSGSVASITTLSGDPRVMQLALRLNW